MRIENELGFILHRRAYSETSWVLDILTQTYGRIALMAKGVRGASKKDPIVLGCCYRLSYAGSGELPLLKQFESIDTRVPGPSLSLALMYLNELLHALLPKADPHPSLFVSYQTLVGQWPNESAQQAHQLRRFEYDFLMELGYGVDFNYSTDGKLIRPEFHYRLDSEAGFSAVSNDAALQSFSGASILALHGPTTPSATELGDLRRMLKQLLSTHLHGKDLQAWTLMSELKQTQQSAQRRHDEKS
jgi:DNA repair protein RecO (recombination protein O)